MRRIAVIALLLVSTGLATAQTAGLMHRYSFTVDANDSIGAAHGTLMNGATIANGALNLDGVGAFLDLPNNLVTRHYFFSHLDKTGWLRPLADAGMFSDPPAAVPTATAARIRPLRSAVRCAQRTSVSLLSRLRTTHQAACTSMARA